MYVSLYSSLRLTRNYFGEGCPWCVLFPQQTPYSFVMPRCHHVLAHLVWRTVDIGQLPLMPLPCPEVLGPTDTESASYISCRTMSAEEQMMAWSHPLVHPQPNSFDSFLVFSIWHVWKEPVIHSLSHCLCVYFYPLLEPGKIVLMISQFPFPEGKVKENVISFSRTFEVSMV